MSDLVIDVHDELTPETKKQLESVFSSMVPAVVERLREKRDVERKRLIDFFLESYSPTSFDVRRAQMNANAFRAIYAGTEWLTAAELGTQLGQLTGKHPANPSAQASRWKTHGEIFAIEHDGKDRYPRYGFGVNWRPVPAMKEVIKLLSGSDPLRLAAWFESTSSFLGGKRPREVIQQGNGDEVIAAARDYCKQLER